MFIHDPDEWCEEVVRLTDLATDILMDTGPPTTVTSSEAERAIDEALRLLQIVETIMRPPTAE